MKNIKQLALLCAFCAIAIANTAIISNASELDLSLNQLIKYSYAEDSEEGDAGEGIYDKFVITKNKSTTSSSETCSICGETLSHTKVIIVITCPTAGQKDCEPSTSISLTTTGHDTECDAIFE